LTQVLGGSWQISVESGAGEATTSEPTGPSGSADSRNRKKPEPDPRDETDESGPGLDPEAEALKLLQDQLGARPVD
jgi:hypothetical protein